MPTVTKIPSLNVEKSKEKLRCAAYCRVSSSSEDQLNSYKAQVDYYTHCFENSDTEMLVDIYADEDNVKCFPEKHIPNNAQSCFCSFVHYCQLILFTCCFANAANNYAYQQNNETSNENQKNNGFRYFFHSHSKSDGSK